MSNKPGAKSNDPIPQRLRAIRIAQGFDHAKEFADFLEVSARREPGEDSRAFLGRTLRARVMR
jgi:hypothetical protein